jgi:hypothetical protein
VANVTMGHLLTTPQQNKKKKKIKTKKKKKKKKRYHSEEHSRTFTAIKTSYIRFYRLHCLYSSDFFHKYYDGYAQSIAGQWLGKHPTTDMHAIIEGRRSLGHAQNRRTQQWEECFLLLGSSQHGNRLAK